jgi:hypothetical protein
VTEAIAIATRAIALATEAIAIATKAIAIATIAIAFVAMLVSLVAGLLKLKVIFTEFRSDCGTSWLVSALPANLCRSAAQNYTLLPFSLKKTPLPNPYQTLTKP